MLEVQKDPVVSGPESVNGLPVVADHAYIVVFSGKEAKELVLRLIGVLILVDKKVCIAAIVHVQDFWMFFEQFYGFQDDVVEIKGILFKKDFFVLFIYGLQLFRKPSVAQGIPAVFKK